MISEVHLDTSPLADAKVLAAVIAAFVAAMISVVSGGWAVWVKVQENRRAKWRRVEELMKILHEGETRGLWAQKLAATEMIAISGQDKQIMKLLGEAASYFKDVKSNDLGYYIDELLKGSRHF